MTKKSLFALLLVAVIALSGCSLVMKNDAVDALQTIIDVNGETVNKQDFMNTYSYNLNYEQYYAQMMQQFGLSDGSVDESTVLQNTVSSFITDLVLRQKATELGFDQFDDAAEAALAEQVETEYQKQLDQIRENYFADSELEGDALTEAVIAYADQNGLTHDYVAEHVRDTEVSNRLRASVTDDITVNDDDLQAALDEKIAADKSSFESSGNAYNSAVVAGNTIYYTPAGYRVIRVARLAKPAVDETGAFNLDEFNAQTADLYARMEEDASLDDLGVTVNEYRVNETSTLGGADVVAAAVMLAEKGQQTAVDTDDAYIVVKYVDDVEEHTATLDEVHDTLYTEVLTDAKNDAYTVAVSEWVGAANVSTYPERLN